MMKSNERWWEPWFKASLKCIPIINRWHVVKTLVNVVIKVKYKIIIKAAIPGISYLNPEMVPAPILPIKNFRHLFFKWGSAIHPKHQHRWCSHTSTSWTSWPAGSTSPPSHTGESSPRDRRPRPLGECRCPPKKRFFLSASIWTWIVAHIAPVLTTKLRFVHQL